ncbi:ABC transporter ATP-binding protein [Nocardioides alcanivorans]|uniref:ABC transporter ATP-binding protein n=1 Tax=Nocardioides alcanivorans TaxID=2897352 RepID=UPI001F292202|nr:ABC transporter ATP-binding protein [Nocardioides alcanivorans]
MIALLEIKNLKVDYLSGSDTLPAARGVTFTVPAGTATALVGESGSGKSTIAMAIMRMIRPPVGDIAGGSIKLDGLDLVDLPDRRMREVLQRDIGFVPQDPTTALDPLYRVRTQIAESMPGVARGELNERIADLLASLGIKDARSRMRSYPHQFSGGMCQRVAIAIALAGDPKVLIADEPTTALDVTTQVGILRLIDQMRRERQLATLLITHDVRVARLLCQNVVVMYGGVVVERGPAREVLNEPRHPYTRALMVSSAQGREPRRPLQVIPGQPATLREMPAGCPFAPRCARALDICTTQMPASIDVGQSSLACWNPEDR